jgi:hypothetical protein
VLIEFSRIRLPATGREDIVGSPLGGGPELFDRRQLVASVNACPFLIERHVGQVVSLSDPCDHGGVLFRRRLGNHGSLFDPLKLDLISRGPEGGYHLYIIQDQPWLNTTEELQSLLAKIDNYARLANEGGLPGASSEASWRVVIDSYAGPPAAWMLHELRSVGSDLRARGGSLVLHELKPPLRWAKLPKTVRVRQLAMEGDDPVTL